MGRKSKGPWHWKERNEWVVNIRGVRHYLGPDKGQAYQQWHEISGTPDDTTPPRFLVELFDKFLDWCAKNRKDSYDWYSSRINEFAKRAPDLTVAQLKPFHVQEWIDTKRSDSHKRGCMVAVSRALNWADKQGLIDKNPIKRMEKPEAGRRDIFLTQEQFDELLSKASGDEFRDLLIFSWETGCRPQEAFRLEARHVDDDRCVFPEKESKGKKKKRVIWLTPVAREIVVRLCKEYPIGRLFRNEDGEPWNRNNVTCRFVRLRQRMSGIKLTKEQLKKYAAELKKRKPTKIEKGKEVLKSNADLQREARRKLRAKLVRGPQYCLYHLRHSYCQRALKNGVDPITLAELMGHSSAAMIMRIYQHLYQDKGHMREAALRAAK